MAEPLASQLIAELRAATERLNDAATAVRGASGRASEVGQGVVEMQHYVDIRVDEVKGSLKTRLEDFQRETDKNVRMMLEKFASSNEIKDAMKDQQSNMPTRPEMEGQIVPIRKELEIVRLGYSKLETDFNGFRESHKEKASQMSVTILGIATVLGLFVSSAMLIVKLVSP